ncbi:uncharacterized protein LOC118191262 [Stegodyphus dumicola]|uniref:uncharacterized protein LOC118191262 n=1 Tax=Stegodyphus dumicola TaxID=202533 RepID=UPI0015AEA47E|nr:uncharacterized protein LOC118191262 [Stegodyphus dumicola]XP_035217955.1 uncharacterized protein LOC118191262 [Stegodyphus dumicola]
MPYVKEISDHVELSATPAEDDRHAELLLAGFRACAKEALRFLLEDEGLAPDHPLPAGLEEHLTKRQCHLADMLHNDSGIDLTESLLQSPTDGDTTHELNSQDELSQDFSSVNESSNISVHLAFNQSKDSLPLELSRNSESRKDADE